MSKGGGEEGLGGRNVGEDSEEDEGGEEGGEDEDDEWGEGGSRDDMEPEDGVDALDEDVVVYWR